MVVQAVAFRITGSKYSSMCMKNVITRLCAFFGQKAVQKIGQAERWDNIESTVASPTGVCRNTLNVLTGPLDATMQFPTPLQADRQPSADSR